MQPLPESLELGGSVEDTPLRKNVRESIGIDGFSRRREEEDPSGVIFRFLLTHGPDVRISHPTLCSSNLHLPRWKVSSLSNTAATAEPLLRGRQCTLIFIEETRK